jgi:hypothetical protein
MEKILIGNEDEEEEENEPMVGATIQAPDGSEDLYLPSTLWLKSELGMDDRLLEAGISLKDMMDRFEIYPVNVYEAKEEMLFLARFEAIAFEQGFDYAGNLGRDEDVKNKDDALMFIDFLGGMLCGMTELSGIVGELSSRKGDIEVIDGEDQASPKMLESMFNPDAVKDEAHAPFSHLWADKRKVDGTPHVMLVENLDGEPLPVHGHWWNRTYIIDKASDMKWPVPGEFLGFCPRIWPSMPWNKQKSNPFMFSGNWMETVHYSNAKVLEVLEPDSETRYPKYLIQYRKYKITAKPTDYTEYKVDERVTIMRLSEKSSWKWKDLTEFDTKEWVIAPISFYNDIANDHEEE